MCVRLLNKDLLMEVIKKERPDLEGEQKNLRRLSVYQLRIQKSIHVLRN